MPTVYLFIHKRLCSKVTQKKLAQLKQRRGLLAELVCWFGRSAERVEGLVQQELCNNLSGQQLKPTYTHRKHGFHHCSYAAKGKTIDQVKLQRGYYGILASNQGLAALIFIAKNVHLTERAYNCIAWPNLGWKKVQLGKFPL